MFQGREQNYRKTISPSIFYEVLYDFCENIRFLVKRGREKGIFLRAKRGEKFPPNGKGIKSSWTQGELEPALLSSNTINRMELGGEE